MKPVCLLYDGGFALAQTPEELIGVVLNTRNVSARSCNNEAEAYISLVSEHVRRNTASNTVPFIPSFEDWRRTPFFVTPNMYSEPVTFGRCFLLINMEYAGVYDNIDRLVNDFLFDETLFIIEVRHELDAVKIINEYYKNRVFRVMPYIRSKIPFITGTIPKNMLHRMHYIELLKTVVMPEEVMALNPLNSNPIGSEEITQSFSEGKENNLLQIAEIVR